MISNHSRSSGKEAFLVSSGSSQPALTRHPSKPDDQHERRELPGRPEVCTFPIPPLAPASHHLLPNAPSRVRTVKRISISSKTPVIPHIPPKTNVECRLFPKRKGWLT